MKYALIFIIGLVIGWAISLFLPREYPTYSPIGADKVYTEMAIKEVKAEAGNHDDFLKGSDSTVVDGQKLVCVIFFTKRGTLRTDGNSKAYCFDKIKNNYVGSF